MRDSGGIPRGFRGMQELEKREVSFPEESASASASVESQDFCELLLRSMTQQL